MLLALLLLLPPLLFTFMKFVAFVTLGDRDHQLFAAISEGSPCLTGLFSPALPDGGQQPDRLVQ